MDSPQPRTLAENRYIAPFGQVAELAYAHGLGPCGETRESSSLSLPTTQKPLNDLERFFVCFAGGFLTKIKKLLRLPVRAKGVNRVVLQEKNQNPNRRRPGWEKGTTPGKKEKDQGMPGRS